MTCTFTLTFRCRKWPSRTTEQADFKILELWVFSCICFIFHPRCGGDQLDTLLSLKFFIITKFCGILFPAYRQEATLGIDVSDSSANCIEQTTEWSACSKSCGMGFSTRVTNRNQQCEMVKQTRLCMMRPCENEEPSDKVCSEQWQEQHLFSCNSKAVAFQSGML